MDPTLQNKCSYASGYVSIDENNGNWIHTAITKKENSALTITNNKLNAYDPNYLDRIQDYLGPYFVGISTNTLNKSAIFVGTDKVEDEGHSGKVGTESACLINNNTTDVGKYQITNNTEKLYYYDLAVIHCMTSSVITNNSLRGIAANTLASPANVILLLQGMRNKVSSNRFYRDDRTISYYLSFIPFYFNSFTFSTGFVTENYLDSPYINTISKDESVFNEILAFADNSGNSARWTIERNTNQTCYETLPITNSQLFAYGNKGIEQHDPFSEDYFISNANDASSGGYADLLNVNNFKSMVLRVHDWSPAIEGDFLERNFSWQENIHKYLPKGVKLIAMNVGVRTFGNTFAMPSIGVPDETTTKFSLFLNKYHRNRFSSNLDSFADVNAPDLYIINDTTSPKATLDGNQLNVTGLTQYLNIDLENYESDGDISKDYVNYDRPLSVSLKIKYKKVNVRTDFLISPLLIKYRW